MCDRSQCTLCVLLNENQHRNLDTGRDKSRFTAVSTSNTDCILISLFINYCIIFHTDNCVPTFAPPGRSIYTAHLSCKQLPRVPDVQPAAELRRRTMIRYLDSGSNLVFLLLQQRSAGGKPERRTMGACGGKVTSCMI